MKAFIAIVRWTDSRLDQYDDFDDLESAEQHCLQYGGFASATPPCDMWHSSKFFVIDGAGKTVTYDQSGQTAYETEARWAVLRTERNVLLDSSDWTQGPDSPLDDTKDDWATYRQELRDLPATTDDPTDVTWPVAPE
jgi:hypothetical protein